MTRTPMYLVLVLALGCAGQTHSLGTRGAPTIVGEALASYYPCSAIRVTDGDTYHVVCRIFDRGRHGETLQRMIVRLHGVDTPEIRGASEAEKARGRAAAEFAEKALRPQDFVVEKTEYRLRLQFRSQDNFGRPLAGVSYWDDGCSCYRDLAEELRLAGHEKVVGR